MSALCGQRTPREAALASPALRRFARITAVVSLAVLAVHHLRGRVPDLHEVLAVLRDAHTGWLIAAGLAIFTSINMYARHQRTLLAAVGVTLPHVRALAVSYSRSAMSYSLPAGSVVSAAYAYRQYLAHRADRRSSATVVALSGALLAAALATLTCAGMLAGGMLGLPRSWIAHPATVVASSAALSAAIILLTRYVTRAVTPRHCAFALAAAIANWSTDLLCLFFVPALSTCPSASSRSGPSTSAHRSSGKSR